MDLDPTGNGNGTAADKDGGDIDLAALQPLGEADIIVVAPGAFLPGCGIVPRERTTDHDLLTEGVEDERAGEGLVVAEGGEYVGLIALGLACEVEPELAGPWRADGTLVDVARGVEPSAQLDDLLLEDGDGDAGRGLDAARTCRSGNGSSRARASRPSSMPSGARPGGLVSDRASASKSATVTGSVGAATAGGCSGSPR
jgi:hypothetical protein